MIKKIGIIGLGTVGEATLKSLIKYRNLIKKRTSLDVKVTKVCDIKREKKRIASCFNIPFSSNPYEIIKDPEIDVVVELIGGISPALEYILSSLKERKSVVTANKALLAEKGEQIFALARKNGVGVGFEASVCGAIPIIRSVREGLVGNEVRTLYGILNGTTNYILYKMSKEKIEFGKALREAQKKGFAEKNPSLDVKGIDTLHKLCILSYLCFGVWPDPSSIYVEGITKISPLDVMYAEELSYRIKLLAIAKKEKNKLSLRVCPTLIRADHPLAEVKLNFNAVWLRTQPAGELLFYGKGAGGVATSSSVIADIVSVSIGNSFLPRTQKIHLTKISELKTRFYVRFMALDLPGVLAKISKILASFNISIASVTQKERKKGKIVPIVMLTHEAKESALKKAIERIDRLEVIKPSTQVIRIEDV